MVEFSNNSLSISFDNASAQINRYFTIVNILFGAVGNILNILVLSRRSLRINPCSWLFLISSIVSLTVIICGLSTQILNGWGADFTAHNHVLCKLRAFIVFNSKTIVVWLIMLATIDRWLLSSVDANHRKKSTLKNAQKNTILLVICSILLYTQVFYCYRAKATGTPLKCYCIIVWCRHLIDLSFALITYLFPIVLMISFGCMTIWNLRQNRRNLLHCPAIKMNLDNIGRSSYRLKKTDSQLITMLIVQITATTLCFMPLVIHRLYLTFTLNTVKTALQESIETCVFSVMLQLSYIGDGMSFYIYTLSGKIFRQELLNLGRMGKQKILYTFQ